MERFRFSQDGLSADARGVFITREGAVRAAVDFARDGAPIFAHTANWTDAAERMAVADELARLTGLQKAPLVADLAALERELLRNGERGEIGEKSDLRPVEAPWPRPLAEEAFHGSAGEAVRAIEPHSEADPAAILLHFPVGVGVLIGPKIHARAGDALHPARLNGVVVGETSKGRKGSAARPVERALAEVDGTFAPARVLEGLSSGEGLIWQVRDPITKYERIGRGPETKTELVEVDPGVADKRLLIIESEFASPLRTAQREGNTLSAVIRRAWDSGDLRTLVKNSPAVATGAHVGIVGHVTRDELLREFAASKRKPGRQPKQKEG
jgi:hypothetical protein